MKNYRVGIILGIISILCALTFVGIPVGFNNIVEIICTVFFALGLLTILCMGFAVKNEKISVIASAAYVVILFVLVAVVELNYNDFTLLAIGFVPGLLISGMGVIKTVKVKSDKKKSIGDTIQELKLSKNKKGISNQIQSRIGKSVVLVLMVIAVLSCCSFCSYSR